MQEANVQRDNRHREEDGSFSLPQPTNGQISEFERILIRECREEGMSDEEIATWLKEI